ncbi:hypothetical protein PENANT_c053G08229, partial [Penicillium antarcticum]
MDPSGYPAGYPVPTQSPQQPFYPNAPYQSKTQHSFAMPMQPGAMIPSGFPQSS